MTDSRCSRAAYKHVDRYIYGREWKITPWRNGSQGKDYLIRLKPAIVDKIAAHPADFTELLAIFTGERLELAVIECIVIPVIEI